MTSTPLTPEVRGALEATLEVAVIQYREARASREKYAELYDEAERQANAHLQTVNALKAALEEREPQETKYQTFGEEG